MSRSVHHTTKSVFRGKTKREVDDMVEGDDPDVHELQRKAEYKDDERTRRASTATPSYDDDSKRERTEEG